MPDYMFLLESRLSAEQRAAVLKVQELAIATESNLYLTGGAVRDLISGMPIRDLDFVTEENPSRLAHELEKNGARIVHDDADTFYCIGGRTGFGLTRSTGEHRETAFAQDRAGLHHVCFRARSREDVDAVHALVRELGAIIVRAPETGKWAPGYY